MGDGRRRVARSTLGRCAACASITRKNRRPCRRSATASALTPVLNAMRKWVRGIFLF